MLEEGAAAKAVLDIVVDANSAMQNLREAIAGGQHYITGGLSVWSWPGHPLKVRLVCLDASFGQGPMLWFLYVSTAGNRCSITRIDNVACSHPHPMFQPDSCLRLASRLQLSPASVQQAWSHWQALQCATLSVEICTAATEPGYAFNRLPIAHGA